MRSTKPDGGSESTENASAKVDASRERSNEECEYETLGSKATELPCRASLGRHIASHKASPYNKRITPCVCVCVCVCVSMCACIPVGPRVLDQERKGNCLV